MIVAMISRMLASTSAALVIGVASGVSGCVDHDGAAAIVFGQPGLTCKFVAANHSCNDHLQQQTFFIRDLTVCPHGGSKCSVGERVPMCGCSCPATSTPRRALSETLPPPPPPRRHDDPTCSDIDVAAFNPVLQQAAVQWIRLGSCPGQTGSTVNTACQSQLASGFMVAVASKHPTLMKNCLSCLSPRLTNDHGAKITEATSSQCFRRQYKRGTCTAPMVLPLAKLLQKCQAFRKPAVSEVPADRARRNAARDVCLREGLATSLAPIKSSCIACAMPGIVTLLTIQQQMASEQEQYPETACTTDAASDHDVQQQTGNLFASCTALVQAGMCTDRQKGPTVNRMCCKSCKSAPASPCLGDASDSDVKSTTHGAFPSCAALAQAGICTDSRNGPLVRKMCCEACGGRRRAQQQPDSGGDGSVSISTNDVFKALTLALNSITHCLPPPAPGKCHASDLRTQLSTLKVSGGESGSNLVFTMPDLKDLDEFCVECTTTPLRASLTTCTTILLLTVIDIIPVYTARVLLCY